MLSVPQRLSSDGKATRQVLLDSFKIGFAEPPDATGDQSTVDREELHPHEAALIKTDRFAIFNPCIALPGGLGLGGDHGEDQMTALVEGPTTHDQSRPPLGAGRLGKGKWNDDHMPRITDHEKPLRPRASSTLRASRRGPCGRRRRTARHASTR